MFNFNIFEKINGVRKAEGYAVITPIWGGKRRKKVEDTQVYTSYQQA
jgi:hypothetical protein